MADFSDPYDGKTTSEGVKTWRYDGTPPNGVWNIISTPDANAAYVAQAVALTEEQAAIATAQAGVATTQSAQATSARVGAEAASLLAQAASEASGLSAIYATKAEADAALAGIAANGVVEVMVDETVAAARTRYRKESGVLVLKTVIGDQPSTRWFGKVAQKLGKAGIEQVRIHLAGTSIATFTPALIQVWARQVRRQYGAPRDRIIHTPISGWPDQSFGGPTFRRNRGSSADSPFDYNTLEACQSVVIRYSKETDGGSFSVVADGETGSPFTVDCNGAQNYRNELTITFDKFGYHTLTFSPPSSGIAYIEAIEERTEQPGVVVEDTAVGGSAACSMFDAFGSYDVPKIDVVGNNGIDAHTSPSTDIFFWQWTVNDVSGGNSSPAEFKIALDAVIARCRAHDTALVCIVEMAGHLATPVNANRRADFEKIRGFQLAAARQYPDFVYALDWHALTYIPNDPVKYAATYYPAVAYNTTTNTYTGDFIHPNGAGQRVGLMALCVATGIDVPTEELFPHIEYRNTSPALAGPSPLLPAQDAALFHAAAPGSLTSWNLFGVPRRLSQVGEAWTPGGLRAVYCSPDIVSLDNGAHSAASYYSSTDEFGAHRLLNNGDVTLQAKPGDFVTVTVLARPRFDLGGGSALALRAEGDCVYWIDGVEASTGFGGPRFFASQLDESDGPRFYSFTFKRGSGDVSINLTGKVYGLWITPTPFACITDRGFAVNRLIGPQMLYQGDPVGGVVTVGQDYAESVNSKLIEKVCIGRDVIKPNLGLANRYGMYRARDLSAITRVRGGFGGVGSVGSWTFNDRQGGYVNPASSQTIQLPTLTGYGATFAGKVFTLLWRFSRASMFDIGWQLYMKNGSSYTCYATLDGGGNVVWTEAAGSVATNAIPLLLTTDVSHVDSPLALTMTMPTLSGSMGDAPSFTLRPCSPSTFASTTVNGGYAFLTEGSSALT